ncbi:MAG TPA: hypothetical protein VKF82_12580 [Candidatus Eremiobacteraceae bacterium]|nr:hypothetical protein [Candidatus Eremiobacteraceae bacterium]
MKVRVPITGFVLTCVLALGGPGVRAQAQDMPQDGAAAPSVPVLQSVIDGGFEPFDLKTASTGTTIVLYFFPQAFTEG